MKAKNLSFSAIRNYAETIFSTDRNKVSDLKELETASLLASEHRRGATYAMFTYAYRIEADALTLKVDNAVNLFSMASARSVFKKIDRSSGDETTHKVCIDFLKSLEKLESLTDAEASAFTFRFNKVGNYKRVTADADAERIISEQDLYFHSLDVFSACRVAIYELLAESGRALNLEAVRPVKKQTREIVYGYDDIPDKVTADEFISPVTSVFRAGNRAVYENGAIKESNPKYLYIPLDEFKDEKERDAKLFRRFNASAYIGGQSSMFATGNAKNAELLKALFDKAEAEQGMTKKERRRTEEKVNRPYLSWEQLARIEGVNSDNAVRKSVRAGLEKLTKVVPEGKAREAMKKYLHGLLEEEVQETRDRHADYMLTVYTERKQKRAELDAIRSAVSIPKNENDCYDFDYWKQSHTDAETLYDREVKALEVSDAFTESKANRNAVIVSTPWSDRKISSDWTREKYGR